MPRWARLAAWLLSCAVCQYATVWIFAIGKISGHAMAWLFPNAAVWFLALLLVPILPPGMAWHGLKLGRDQAGGFAILQGMLYALVAALLGAMAVLAIGGLLREFA